MSSDKRLNTVKYTLQPLDTFDLGVSGNSFTCLSANIPFQIRAEEDQFSDFKKGYSFKGDTFTKLTIKNTSSSTSLTVELGVAFGELLDNSLVISGGDPINTKKGGVISNGSLTVGTSEIEVLAENSTRLGAIIVNNHATNILYIGGVGVTTSNGVPVQPSGSFTVETGAQIKAIASGSSTDIRIYEELI